MGSMEAEVVQVEAAGQTLAGPLGLAIGYYQRGYCLAIAQDGLLLLFPGAVRCLEACLMQ